MSVVDVDPLAVLPITAAAASATFARPQTQVATSASGRSNFDH